MNALFVALLTYITVHALIFVFKPSYFYEQHELRDFGVKQGQCIFPYYVTALGVAVLVYVMVCICDRR